MNQPLFAPKHLSNFLIHWDCCKGHDTELSFMARRFVL